MPTGQISVQNPSISIDPNTSSSYGPLLDRLMGSLPGAPPDYQSFLNQGVNSPLMQSVLGPALNNLLPGQNLARQNLNDQFRSNGALGSGAQYNASNQLETGFQNSDASLISQVMSSMLPQMTQGLNQQYQNQMAIPGLLGSILGQTRPLVGSGGGSSTPVNFGSSNSSGDFMSSFLQDYQRNNANNPYSSFSGASFGNGGDDSGILDRPIDTQAPFDYAAYDRMFSGGATRSGGNPNNTYADSGMGYIGDGGGDQGLMGYRQGYDESGMADTF